jgi:hypothetical protein
MPILPLPRTARRRAEHFNPTAPLPSVHHQNPLVPRASIIQSMANKTGGINRKMWVRLKKGVKKIEGIYGKKLSKRELRIRQALFLDELAAEAADHAVEGLRKVGASNTMAGLPEGHKLTQAQVDKMVWEKSFSKTIISFRGLGAEAAEIIRTLQQIRQFTTVPLRVHFERSKHWTIIKRIVEELKAKKVNPEENLLGEIKRILGREFKASTNNPKRLARLKALDVIVAASIYADLMAETKGTNIADKAQKESFWDYAYSEGMEKAYPLLAGQENILQEILSFNAKSPRK